MKRKATKAKKPQARAAKAKARPIKQPPASKTREVTELDLGNGQKLQMELKDDKGQWLPFMQINGVPIPNLAGIANRVDTLGYRLHSVVPSAEGARTCIFERA